MFLQNIFFDVNFKHDTVLLKKIDGDIVAASNEMS